MNTIRKIFLSVFTLVCLSICFITSVSANTEEVIELPSLVTGEVIRIPVGNAKYYKGYDGKLHSINELPKIDSEEEKAKFVETQENIEFSYMVDESNSKQRSTIRDVAVSSYKMVTATIQLRLNYTTSGSNNTGRILQHNAYTSVTGLTAFQSWEETSCTSTITNSGKDIYVQARGAAIYSILSGGVIEVSRAPVNISGTVYVIR